MKNKLLTILIIALSLNTFAQVQFQKGHIIKQSGEKVECLIKNSGWKNNPTEISYKLSADSDIKTATVDNIKEFEIYNEAKFIKSTVNIDKSSKNLNKLSTDKKPKFVKETLFLKVLIEGDASLYYYLNRNLKRFFFKTSSQPIKQLVYKEYLGNTNKLLQNNQYKQQLLNNLECSSITISKINSLSYNKKPISNLFALYNTCKSSDYTNYLPNKKRNAFNLNVKVGVRNSTLDIKNTLSLTRDANFGSKLGFIAGLEFEYILPFNRDKWSVALEPTYQQFKDEQQTETRIVNVDYKSIELPITVRHYLFLNEDSKIFINASYVLDFANKSSNVKYDNDSRSLEINTKQNIALGLGYKFKDKYSLEVRYNTKRHILNNFAFYETNYNSTSILFGYTIF